MRPTQSTSIAPRLEYCDAQSASAAGVIDGCHGRARAHSPGRRLATPPCVDAARPFHGQLGERFLASAKRFQFRATAMQALDLDRLACRHKRPQEISKSYVAR
jgi:hypothetical protein